jgi:hypothetical protein
MVPARFYLQLIAQLSAAESYQHVVYDNAVMIKV